MANRLLTIGMPTFDDYDGVYFTVQALRLYHPEVMRDVEILVVDNNPGGPAGPALIAMAERCGLRYVPYDEVQGTAPAKNQVFRQASTPWVMCVDCHVLFAPGAIRRFLDWVDANPDSNDLLQGPLMDDSLQPGILSTHFRPTWDGFMFGQWDIDDRGKNLGGEPFEIPMQGLGVFACRKEAWLGFNPAFRGFGGEEGYIHYKYELAGYRTLCLPFLRWMHRFDRPVPPAYANTLEGRLRNYLLGCAEIGQDPSGIEAHFRAGLGDEEYEAMRGAIDMGANDATS